MSRKPVRTAVTIALLTFATLACQRASEAPKPEPTATDPPAPPVVEIRTSEYAFHAPSEVASGWNTLQMTNEGKEPHFLVLWLLPEGKTFDDFVQDVFNPFMDVAGRFKAGEIELPEMVEELDESLPDWADFPELGQGGVGITSPGRSAETTVNLVPGNYVMECYMVTAEGEFHNQLGMLRPLTVTQEANGAQPPEADVELALSNDGIAVDGELGPGRHTVKVTVTERPPGLVGHDAHLARLDDDTPIETVTSWMSWVNGLQPPAPAQFRGGAEQVPAGHASYVDVDLEPGRYAWISEAYSSLGVVKEFQVE